MRGHTTENGSLSEILPRQRQNALKRSKVEQSVHLVCSLCYEYMERKKNHCNNSVQLFKGYLCNSQNCCPKVQGMTFELLFRGRQIIILIIIIVITLLTITCTCIMFISSSEHEVLKVSYCDRLLSVVCHPSSVVRQHLLLCNHWVNLEIHAQFWFPWQRNAKETLKLLFFRTGLPIFK